MRIRGRSKSAARPGILLSLCALLLASSSATAQGPERRIRFRAGKTSAVVKGRLVNSPGVDEAWQNYVLKVGEGQTVTVRLTSQGEFSAAADEKITAGLDKLQTRRKTLRPPIS